SLSLPRVAGEGFFCCVLQPPARTAAPRHRRGTVCHRRRRNCILRAAGTELHSRAARRKHFLPETLLNWFYRQLRTLLPTRTRTQLMPVLRRGSHCTPRGERRNHCMHRMLPEATTACPCCREPVTYVARREERTDVRALRDREPLQTPAAREGLTMPDVGADEG